MYSGNKKKKGSSTGSSSSKLSTESIQLLVNKLKNERNRSSTRKTYYEIWKNFNEFFVTLDKKPDSWDERLVLFIGFLIESKRKANTIASYISAIKCVLKEDGYYMNEDKYLLFSLTKACRYKNCQVRTRLPISKRLLYIILDQTATHFEDSHQHYLSLMYQALFAAAYFGMFRVGEVTSGTHPVRAPDVHLAQNKKKLFFILHTSKTHWEDSQPQLIKISSVNDDWDNNHCPFVLIRRFLAVRKPCNQWMEPFFIFSDGSPVTPSHMRTTL